MTEQVYRPSICKCGHYRSQHPGAGRCDVCKGKGKCGKYRQGSPAFIPTVCPRPDKAAYHSQRAATNAMAGVISARKWRYAFIRAYRCDCGEWHLTTKPRR